MPEDREEPQRRSPRAAGRRVSTERLREVFGDVLPETTSDERDDAEPADTSGRDEWMQENRPPHH